MLRNLLKLILIGDSQVGKTKLLIRFTDGVFSPESMTTIGVDFKEKPAMVHGTSWRLQIWDTAGQERFKTITESYYRRANGALIVFDLTSLDSFNNVDNWLESLSRAHDSSPPAVLVGNKCDLTHQVSFESAQELAKRHKLQLFMTSALTGEGISEAFQTLAELIVDRNPANAVQSAETSPVVSLRDDSKEKKTGKKGCC
jgi:Ras-related protein Rab-1A